MKKLGNKKKHADQASIAEETDGSCDVFIACTKYGRFDDWFFYSGCSYYMPPKKSWFCTYEDYNEKTILMGNNETIEIGSIKLQMLDWKVQILTNMRHVLDLKKNMISLKVLWAAGWKFLGDDTMSRW